LNCESSFDDDDDVESSRDASTDSALLSVSAFPVSASSTLAVPTSDVVFIVVVFVVVVVSLVVETSPSNTSNKSSSKLAEYSLAASTGFFFFFPSASGRTDGSVAGIDAVRSDVDGTSAIGRETAPFDDKSGLDEASATDDNGVVGRVVVNEGKAAAAAATLDDADDISEDDGDVGDAADDGTADDVDSGDDGVDSAIEFVWAATSTKAEGMGDDGEDDDAEDDGDDDEESDDGSKKALRLFAVVSDKDVSAS